MKSELQPVQEFLTLKNSKNVIVKTDYKKVYKELVLETTRIKQCVYNEIEAYQEIKSDFLPKFYEYNRVEDKIIMTMEYIEGKTLFEYKSLPRSNLIILCLELAMGLRDIFNHGFIHGDIKPENIVCSHRGCYFLDLGFSSRVEPLDPTSKYIRGTIPYMIPELVLGQIRASELTADILKKNDIYSLGNVFHYIYKGQTVYPFSKTDSMATYQKKLMDSYPSIQTGNHRMDHLIEKMIEKSFTIHNVLYDLYDIWEKQQIQK